MLLSPEKSLCEKNQAIVISKDRGTQRVHRAINYERKFDLRQYKLDGDIVKQETCCDFLLANDSTRKAYLIELKGKNIDDAVEQLEAGEKICKPELRGYLFYYRIVCSKVRTHKVQSPKFRKYKEKCGVRLEMKVNCLEEKLN